MRSPSWCKQVAHRAAGAPWAGLGCARWVCLDAPVRLRAPVRGQTGLRQWRAPGQFSKAQCVRGHKGLGV